MLILLNSTVKKVMNAVVSRRESAKKKYILFKICKYKYICICINKSTNKKVVSAMFSHRYTFTLYGHSRDQM